MYTLVLLFCIFQSQSSAQLKGEKELSRDLSIHMLGFVRETKDLISDIDSSAKGFPGGDSHQFISEITHSGVAACSSFSHVHFQTLRLVGASSDKRLAYEVFSSEVHAQGVIADKIAKQISRVNHKLASRAAGLFRKHRDKMYSFSREFSRVASNYPGADRFDVDNFDIYEEVMDELKR